MWKPSLSSWEIVTCRKISGLIIFLMLALVYSPGVQAAEVGSFTQVEGQVNLLKSGKSPAIPVAVQTGIEMKDVVNTESASRAQLRFLDDTTLTVSPLSQITIESYMYDAQKGIRQVVLEVTQGLVQTVVSKIFRGTEPDFLLKSQTAVMGVRGTEFYVLVIENPSPPSTSGFAPDFFKALRVRALEVPRAPVSTDVFVKSGRVIMSSSNPDIKDTVLLGANQSLRVSLNRPPGPRISLTQKDFHRLNSSMFTGVTPAQVGHTKTPKELLRKLPVTPPRPQKSVPGKGLAPGSSQSAPPLKSKMESSKSGVKQPSAATKPARVAPLKPSQKEPIKAASPKPKKEPSRAAPTMPRTRMTPPKPAPKETPRAAPPQPKRGPSRVAPAVPSKREPSRVTKPKPSESSPFKPAPPQKPGLPER